MRHLLRVRDIPDAELLWLLDRADTLAKAHFITDRASSPLAGKTIINLFFEPSTRTLEPTHCHQFPAKRREHP
jgi:aspartate carbamoyltransferase catalytic subunit